MISELAWAARAAFCVAALLLATPTALAQKVSGPPAPMPIGFAELADDPRFDSVLANFHVPSRPWGPNVGGARMGIVDAEQIGKVINVDFELREAKGASLDELAGVVRGWGGDGVHFVVVDLPSDQLLTLADAVRDAPMTLLNISAQSDSLRGEACRDNIVHIIPSQRMATDAMVQYLVFRNWKNILVLRGPNPQDQEIVDALTESVGFFGARIVEVRPFLLSADPRRREENNVALVTQGNNYDVIFVADADGEFARNVPYQTNPPRPVVGSAGLTAEAWHWAFERQGAPQANARFESLNEGRRMHSFDWAAWAAVRAVTQSVLRTRSTEYDAVRAYLLSDKMNLDGSKGNPMSVRPWDHQLRQGMLIATGNSVVELAPIPGFLHETNDLDTLGVDAPRTKCQM